MQETIKKIMDKIQNCPCFQKGGILGPEAPDCTRVKIPFFKMALGPFSLLLDNPRVFFSLSLPYALLLSALSFVCGFSYLCFYSSFDEVSVFCSNSYGIYLLYFLLKIYIISLFFIKWCEGALLQEKFEWKRLFPFGRRSVRVCLMFLVFIILNCTPFLSGFILYVREPNPDWRVEIAFFAVMSIGFIIPFWLIRFYSLLAFCIYGQPLPNLRELWVKNSGNTLNLVSGLFLLLILSMILFSGLYQNFSSVAHQDSFYIAFISEYLYDFLLLMVAACIANYCSIQQQQMFKEPLAKGCEKE